MTNAVSGVYDKLQESGGFALFGRTGFSTYAHTDSRMYSYLPADLDRLKRTQMLRAAPIFMIRTKELYDRVLRWWVYCAMDPDCISPKNSSKLCPKTVNDWFNHQPPCHRQDQSALNILLANMYNHKIDNYSVRVYQGYIQILEEYGNELGFPKSC